MQNDRKYTDADIRADYDLIRIAEEYCFNYTGSFDFVQGCRDLVAGGGSLNVSLARAVLNCMRVDPTVQSKLPEQKPLVQVDPFERRPRLQIANRPAYYVLRAKFKMTFVLSRAKNATAAHLLRPEKTELWWYPYTSTYSLRRSTWCGALRHSDHAEMTNDSEGRHICLQCMRNRDESNDR